MMPGVGGMEQSIDFFSGRRLQKTAVSRPPMRALQRPRLRGRLSTDLIRPNAQT
jgi:hypothetical protein